MTAEPVGPEEPGGAPDPPQADGAAPPDASAAPGETVDARPGEPADAAEPASTADAATEPASPDPVETAQEAVERLAVGRSPDVRPDDAWAEAGRKVLRFHLARMLNRTAGAVSGDDPEDVHAMRVASRRMRAAWRVFGSAFERDVERRYRTDLRTVGGLLGVVRDLDVLIESLVVYGEGRTERERTRLAPLLAAWRAEREVGRAALVAHLESGAFVEFVAEYETLVETPGLAARPVLPHAPDLVRHRMPATIWTAYGDVWVFDRDLAGAEITTLHEARIAAKWLRYTLEFAREALEPEAATLIGRVVAVQDHLGVLHDMHVASTLAGAFVAATPTLSSGERVAIERFVKRMDRGVARLREPRTLGSNWKPVVAPGYRRALGRALARL